MTAADPTGEPAPETSPGRWLRTRLAQERLLIAPGAYDAVSARLIAHHSFEAVYCGGYAAVASGFGLPDLGLLGMAEMLDIYGRLAGASGLPAIVDADTGYGGPLNIARTVTALRRIGVAGLQIEDQVNPKQCGHLERKEVVHVKEALTRVRVAVDASAGAGPAVIARVDALQPEGLESAIERGNLYRAAGADAILIDAPRDQSDVEAIRRAVPGPLVFNAARTGTGPTFTMAELERLGYAMVILPIDLLYTAYGAMNEALGQLARTGEFDPEYPPRPTFDDFNAFLGLRDLLGFETRFAELQDLQATGGPTTGHPGPTKAVRQ